MALPPNFDDTEHLQATVRRYLNRQIKEDFADLNDASGNWEPTIGTSRESMRKALLHEDTDSLLVTNTRMMLYYFTFGKASQLQPAIVGMSKEAWDLQQTVAYSPHIFLYFKQDSDAVPTGYYPIEADISFRLTNETSSSLTQANLETLANKIKAELGTGQGYTFDKGKYLCKYVDKENGYDFQLYTLNEAEGERVVKKIIGIRNHPYDDDKFKVTVPRRKSVNTTGNILILGKSRKKYRWRPTAKVRFLYAQMLVYNRPEPICLVDRTGKKRNAIVTAY